MKHEYVNSRIINVNIEEAFKVIDDCEGWPKFIPECLKVEMLEHKKNSYTRYMKSKVNGTLLEMKTFCEINHEDYKITFRQVMSPWPIKSNEGEWYLVNRGNSRVELFLVHRIECKYGIIGDWIIKKFIGPKYVHAHGELVLKAFANKLEGRISV